MTSVGLGYIIVFFASAALIKALTRFRNLLETEKRRKQAYSLLFFTCGRPIKAYTITRPMKGIHEAVERLANIVSLR